MALGKSHPDGRKSQGQEIRQLRPGKDVMFDRVLLGIPVGAVLILAGVFGQKGHLIGRPTALSIALVGLVLMTISIILSRRR
jgi:hypothetical protein